MSLKSLARRPVASGLSWATAGLAGGVVLPKLMVQTSLANSSSIVTTTFCSGAICVLLPMGMARGILSATKEAVVDSGAAENFGRHIHATYVANGVGNERERVGKKISSVRDTFWDWNGVERPPIGSAALGGWVGERVRKAVMSRLLPRTSAMIGRVQSALADKGPSGASDADIAAAATSALCEVYIQEKKDTVTMVGSIFYVFFLGIGLAVDHSFGEVWQKKQDLEEQIDYAWLTAKERVTEALDVDNMNSSKNETIDKIENAMEKVDFDVKDHKTKTLQKMEEALVAAKKKARKRAFLDIQGHNEEDRLKKKQDTSFVAHPSEITSDDSQDSKSQLHDSES